MYKNQELLKAETQVIDYIGNILMWTNPDVFDKIPQWDKGSARMLDTIVKDARTDPRRQSVKVVDRLRAYSEYHDRALPLASEFRKYMSEAEYKHFIEALETYFVETFEAGYHPKTEVWTCLLTSE